MTSAKAIIGGILSAILAGLTSLATVLVGNATLSTVTTGQWIAVLIAVITSGGSVYGGVWAVTNNPAPKIASLNNGAYDISSIPSSPIIDPTSQIPGAVINSGSKIGDTPFTVTL